MRLFFELSPAAPQLSGDAVRRLRHRAAWGKGNLGVSSGCPPPCTVAFVLLGSGGFFGSIMTLFLLSCDGFSSFVVSSRFSRHSSLLPGGHFAELDKDG